MYIREFIETTERWKNCPMANYVCPVAKYTRLETNTPRGKAFILSLVLSGLRNFDEEVVKRVYECDLCRACEAVRRDKETSIPDLILAARRDIVELGYMPAVLNDIRNKVISETKLLDENWLKDKINEINSVKEKVVLVTYDSKNCNKLQKKLSNIMNEVGIDTLFLDIGKFPAPVTLLYEAGFYDDSMKMLNNFLRLVESNEEKRFVFTVPYDLEIFFSKYDLENKQAFGSQLFHLIEFIKDNLQDNFFSKKISGTKKKKVLFFDFESPRNSDKFYDIPRYLLRKVEGIEVLEMAWSRKESNSSGGVLLPYVYPEIASGIIDMVIEEAHSYKPEVLVTPCVHCVDNFYLMRRDNYPLEIDDLYSFLSDLL